MEKMKTKKEKKISAERKLLDFVASLAISNLHKEMLKEFIDNYGYEQYCKGADDEHMARKLND